VRLHPFPLAGAKERRSSTAPAERIVHRLNKQRSRARSNCAASVEIAERRVSRRIRRLRRAATGLNRVLVERGDAEGRRRLVEGALRLTRASGGLVCPIAPPSE
jgi:hypothetical protein